MTPLPLYMLDTNVFNDLCDENIPLSIFGGHRLIATAIQFDELRNTPKIQRRTALLDKFQEVAPEVVNAASFAFDIEGAGWNQADWNDSSGNFDRMLTRLKELDEAKGRKKRPLNQERDILIAETAIKAGAILVSGDVSLRCVVREYGGCAKAPADF